MSGEDNSLHFFFFFFWPATYFENCIRAAALMRHTSVGSRLRCIMLQLLLLCCGVLPLTFPLPPPPHLLSISPVILGFLLKGNWREEGSWAWLVGVGGGGGGLLLYSVCGVGCVGGEKRPDRNPPKRPEEKEGKKPCSSAVSLSFSPCFLRNERWGLKVAKKMTTQWVTAQCWLYAVSDCDVLTVHSDCDVLTVHSEWLRCVDCTQTAMCWLYTVTAMCWLYTDCDVLTVHSEWLRCVDCTQWVTAMCWLYTVSDCDVLTVHSKWLQCVDCTQTDCDVLTVHSKWLQCVDCT